MTKPADFYNNVVATMKYLDSVLPSGSHVLLTGLANGNSKLAFINHFKQLNKFVRIFKEPFCMMLSLTEYIH